MTRARSELKKQLPPPPDLLTQFLSPVSRNMLLSFSQLKITQLTKGISLPGKNKIRVAQKFSGAGSHIQLVPLNLGRKTF